MYISSLYSDAVIPVVPSELTITRNMAVINHFTPPKTESGNRTIKLTNSAIEPLKEQMALTRMGKQIKVDVHLREFGRIRKDDCTFVFSARLSARNGKGGEWYSPGVFSGTWNFALKKGWHSSSQSLRNKAHFCMLGIERRGEPQFCSKPNGAHFSADGVQRLRKMYELEQQQSDGHFKRRIYG